MLLVGGCARVQRMPGRWVDLTHSYNADTIYWPTAEEFKLETEFEGQTEKGYYYEANRYSASEHGGTHLDAPAHFHEGGASVEALSLGRLIGQAVVVDVSAKALADADYQVSVEDLEAWERKFGPIPAGSLLFVRTGYDRYWPDRGKYIGTDQRGPEAVALLHFPGLHPDAARWLVNERNIKLFGIDTASIDYGQSKLFETHQVLFAASIPAVENVANLGKVPATGSTVMALPMKIEGGSGAPVRIVARVPHSEQKSE
jgi:kynurenine formamidase